jgi:hypothetical protein
MEKLAKTNLNTVTIHKPDLSGYRMVQGILIPAFQNQIYLSSLQMMY